jgi:hypothetical protein
MKKFIIMIILVISFLLVDLFPYNVVLGSVTITQYPTPSVFNQESGTTCTIQFSISSPPKLITVEIVDMDKRNTIQLLWNNKSVTTSGPFSVLWDANARKVTVTLGSNTIELWIGKSIAKVNGIDTPIDASNPKVVPEIINSRTMLPLRFVTEKLGCDVQWDGTTKTITITYPKS